MKPQGGRAVLDLGDEPEARAVMRVEAFASRGCDVGQAGKDPPQDRGKLGPGKPSASQDVVVRSMRDRTASPAGRRIDAPAVAEEKERSCLGAASGLTGQAPDRPCHKQTQGCDGKRRTDNRSPDLG